MMTPKCGVHVATVMVLVEAKAPSWLVCPDGADQFLEDDRGGGAHKNRFQRKYWKCPMPGCFRVAAFSYEGQEERKCPQCGGPSDADAILRAHGENKCGDCRRAYGRAWHAKQKEKREARAGLGKGFYASARAKRIARELAGEEPEKEFAIRDGAIVATEAVA